MKSIRIFILLFTLGLAGNSYAVSGKVVKHAFIAVAFEIDTDGHVKSLKTQSEANAALQPQLLEKFENFRFGSRKHDGSAVPATVQTIVAMQAVQTADGKVHLVFDKPKEQAVRIGGDPLDFLALENLADKRAVTFAVKINIRSDGSVAQIQVKSKGRKASQEAVELIKNTVAKWRFAVDIEDGIPQEMTADIDIRIGLRFNPHMPPIQRPGINY